MPPFSVYRSSWTLGKCDSGLSVDCPEIAKKNNVMCKLCWEIADEQEQENTKQAFQGTYCTQFGCWESAGRAYGWCRKHTVARAADHSAVASPPATASPLSQAASSSEQVVSEEMRLGRGTFGNTGMKGIPWASRQSQAVKGDSLFELHKALSPLPSRRRKDADGRDADGRDVTLEYAKSNMTLMEIKSVNALNLEMFNLKVDGADKADRADRTISWIGPRPRRSQPLIHGVMIKVDAADPSRWNAPSSSSSHMRTPTFEEVDYYALIDGVMIKVDAAD